MLRIANNDLECVYNYYLDLIQRDFNPDYKYDDIKNIQERQAQFLYFLIDFYEKNKLPIVVSDEEWENYDGNVTYHGFRKVEHAANFLWDTVYHYGVGCMNNGFYTTTSYEEANDYAFYNRRRTEPLKIKTPYENAIGLKDLDLLCDAFYINKKDIKEIDITPDKKQRYLEILQFVNSKNDKLFKRLFTDDVTCLAVIMGYDTIHTRVLKEKYISVLNRGCITVRESDVNAFMRAAGGSYSGLKYSIESEVDENDRT